MTCCDCVLICAHFCADSYGGNEICCAEDFCVVGADEEVDCVDSRRWTRDSRRPRRVVKCPVSDISCILSGRGE